jgi:NADPH:quinone reductase-like Zn-dependent oxidoreductase
MRALVATRIDADHPLDVLELTTDWPAPEPRPGWAVIRVAATSVNPHDLWSMRGVGTDPALFPIVLGCDVVGWDARGEPVIVHPVFGDPDRGGGDETLDP